MRQGRKSNPRWRQGGNADSRDAMRRVRFSGPVVGEATLLKAIAYRGTEADGVIGTEFLGIVNQVEAAFRTKKDVPENGTLQGIDFDARAGIEQKMVLVDIAVARVTAPGGIKAGGLDPRATFQFSGEALVKLPGPDGVGVIEDGAEEQVVDRVETFRQTTHEFTLHSNMLVEKEVVSVDNHVGATGQRLWLVSDVVGDVSSGRIDSSSAGADVKRLGKRESGEKSEKSAGKKRE